MIFTETVIKGAFIIEPEPLPDERGFFAGTWSAEEFLAHGLNSRIAQCNISFNKQRGTVRGMHYQTKPHEEAKLVRCTAGSIFDVIVDLRADSQTKRKWVGVELTARNRRMLYIAEGFAHGYQTLEDDTEVAYQMSEYYHPESARGLRWNDPALGIEWPLAVSVISKRDTEFDLL
ncbi:MAG: dTDP-4-dehydrorhamnose 3,5-epimerase [Blastocatellia bacterium]|jgi:dTDP-4-dehydrorhamnose 3,5-epimerase|nr:dTDP-4-dehydrorhamnose 3,5-epimerase [Blastocatellia bacterium]